MPDFSTELTAALLDKVPVEEFFRQHLETAINEIIRMEQDAFFGYEKYASEGWNTGNSRNGSYTRVFHTKYGALHIVIPRDRNGLFHQQTIPKHQRSSDSLETTVVQLYGKGITTREISDLIEKMYGHCYTPQTVSNMTRSVARQVEEFHSRPVADRFAVIYCDATYINLRRDSVAKEALHVIQGITPDGQKEVLDYAIYPTETAENYVEMLRNLKERGLKQVLLFVSDGLGGLADALKAEFPGSMHQSCWVHLCRSVARHVRPKDRKEVMDDLKKVYTKETAEEAKAELACFIAKYQKKYPRLSKIFANEESLYSFYEFPKSIRASIYTSNMIENNNKGLKHRAKLKEQFPNEDSLDRFACAYYSDCNRKSAGRAHKGFKEAESVLLEMFSSLEVASS